ncbi:hypothetical protein [Actinomadura sp. CNU-125]|uniref:hypothetical protein n=1 Tax=Actinomadura sp. CNU-125 TaxID=1904961 RepID=UPI0009FB5F77|nr:hypothetical protein [Actinomadura sp. CNU-125]
MRDDERTLRLLLKAAPPSARAEIFEAAMRGVDLTTAEFGDDLLDVLPRDVRVREARRMLGLRAVGDVAQRVRQMTAFLPFEEARPVLAELTRRPDADERGAGTRCSSAARGASATRRSSRRCWSPSTGSATSRTRSGGAC